MREHIAAVIRIVQPSDYEDLTRFFEENNRPEITKHFHPFPISAQTAHDIVWTSHIDRYYVALHKERIIGLCMLRGWDEGFVIPSFGVFVDYRHHSLGLGRQLTEFAINEARILNCSAIRLSVYASNQHAKHLYESLGFRESSRDPAVVTGQPDMKIVMIKDLE